MLDCPFGLVHLLLAYYLGHVLYFNVQRGTLVDLTCLILGKLGCDWRKYEFFVFLLIVGNLLDRVLNAPSADHELFIVKSHHLLA